MATSMSTTTTSMTTPSADEDTTGMNEACGLFGLVTNSEGTKELDVPRSICSGLVALQHRGQESAGIVTSKGDNNGKLAVHKGNGLVSSVFNEEHMVRLKGTMGIGHTRYSTMGGTDMSNCQPFVVYNAHGIFTMAHNGELINSQHVRKMVLKQGVGLTTNSDSELITQLISRPPVENETEGMNWVARVRHLMEQSPTAYSLLIMHNDKIYAVRDPFGNRPLCLGKIVQHKRDSDKHADDEPDGWVVSSESCAFPYVGAKYIRDVEPGEIVELTRHGIKSIDVVSRPKNKAPAFCIFEYVYFARPDSMMEGQTVYKARFQCGMQLAKEAPVDADLVAPIPDSSGAAAQGFASQSGLQFLDVLHKTRYVGRTFIQPSKSLRQQGVAQKFGVLVDNCKDKRIVLIDDSIVRGNTIAPIIRMLKDNGALEVHIRIASPPIRFPCYMGINIPTRDELIANHKDENQLARDTGATSLVHLTVEGLLAAIQKNINKESVREVGHCTACLTGKYPINLDW